MADGNGPGKPSDSSILEDNGRRWNARRTALAQYRQEQALSMHSSTPYIVVPDGLGIGQSSTAAEVR